MQEEFLTLEETELLSKEELVELEELSKSCPRCNGKSANPSNPSGRCREHLNKLARDKKTPGHWQRAQTKSDDSLRRQNGKNGTASHKSKGRGSRKEIVDKIQRAEKKTGQKLSPDRINNERGYESKNVRAIPEKLNRGRHKVDPKKLAAWKKRLKKHGIELEDFMTLLRAKALQNGNETLEKTLNMLDIERLLSHLPFKETSEEKLQKADDEIEDLLKALKDEIGNTHTVEVHPDIDHMLRAKSFIKDSGKDAIHLSGFKKSGISPNIVDKLPRDGKGFVSPDMIDSHIASLPKKKIDVDILPYNQRQQMHRDNPEYVLSMRMHPEEKAKMGMDKREEAAWDHLKQNQHSWDSSGESNNKNQIGWVRVDPHKNTPEGAVPHDHWHLDEIQSDFQNKKKIKSKLPYTIDEDIDKMLGNISHGHDDPQHLMHSVANALGRRLGVQSTSMDMPEDQAKKSFLSGYRGNNDTQGRQWVNAPRHRTVQGWNHLADDHIKSIGIPEEHSAAVWGKHGQKLVDEHMAEDPDFKSAADKLGSDKLKEFAELAHNRTEGFMFNGEGDDGWDQAHDTRSRGEGKISTDLADKLKDMSGDERNALSQFMLKHSGNMQSHVAEMNGWGERPDDDAPTGWWSDEAAPQEEQKKQPLPIHQINTYNKRPKKLGMEPVNKEDILGQHPGDKAKQIQYSKLHKKLEQINETLKKSK